MSREVTNVGASVRARLREYARTQGEDFNLTLQRYGAERFLFRLGESAHRERLVLKGAMLFALWGREMYRSTRDLDFTGYGKPEELTRVIADVCATPCPEDGVAFLLDSIRAEPIREDAEYGGFRVKVTAVLDGARIPMQIDVGFGNAIHPEPSEVSYPTLLPQVAPAVRAYPREAVVAEKLHALTIRAGANTRLKDFYDLHVLSKRFSFQGSILTRAIAMTFQRRQTEVTPALPVALSTGFYGDASRAGAWRAYLERNRLPGSSTDFETVGGALSAFLEPAWRAVAQRESFSQEWEAGGPWR